ncbi:hypothetical protein CHY_0801 [Carboxydothermus hydrogenoformans Z-2901]|uniref:Uncharacterized protein n=1 Tax=Carboxydothermus hydrogenoformans (strain ATCC BAA-161 / DSM 6008 / Z-2901) TaxID=246194 RepID=Q3ADX9_CARHZ|nr:hypothetical protein CHY_0801 [Carboxydothermus hydrogenoformans Z-2901]
MGSLVELLLQKNKLLRVFSPKALGHGENTKGYYRETGVPPVLERSYQSAFLKRGAFNFRRLKKCLILLTGK